MENNEQHFYVLGRRIACGIYDPVTHKLRVVYRSGRSRNFFEMSPIQILALLSGALKSLVPTWIPVFSPLSLFG